MPTAASNDQKYRSLPCPNGCCRSAGGRGRRGAVSSRTSVTESPTECAASDSSAAEPVNRPASVFMTAMPTLTASATSTVTTLSGCDVDWSAMAGEERLRLGTGERVVVSGQHTAGGPPAGAFDEAAVVDGYPAKVADQAGDHRLGGRVVTGEVQRQRFGAVVQSTQPPDQQMVERLDEPGSGYQFGHHLAGPARADVDELVVDEVVGGVDDDLAGERADPGERLGKLVPPGRQDHDVGAGEFGWGDRRRGRAERGDQVGQRRRAARVGQQYPVPGAQPDRREGLRHLAGAEKANDHRSSRGRVSSGV